MPKEISRALTRAALVAIPGLHLRRSSKARDRAHHRERGRAAAHRGKTIRI